MLIPLLLAGLAAFGDTTDFAVSARMNDWLHHPVYGDPSFDNFVHANNNPVYRGAPPLEWPVNCFLFEDPASGDWFLYVGRYAKNYEMGPEKQMACLVMRSKDRGMSWESLGPAFPPEQFRFDAETSPVGYAPDVSVVYADGRYHMIYDWASADTRWESAANPLAPADNGVGYAWAERPEGPFIRTSQPVYSTRKASQLMGKYRRGYAASLVKREHDWMVLFMMDSGPNFSWALFGTVSEKPEGPYSDPVALRCVEGNYFHPPLLEYFPAFQHEGWIYAPSTSVALNRNFQGLFRARIGDAMRSEAWELAQCGSVWHSDPVPNEHYGIWGQTFSGFVDREKVFHVMFPSRDPEGMGTINLASRLWDKPSRDCGFVLSGHQGPSITLLKQTYGEFTLDAELVCQGTVSIVWSYTAPLGPNRAAADATLHPLSLTRHQALELTEKTWRIVRGLEQELVETVASGSRANPSGRVVLSLKKDGDSAFVLDNDVIWSCNMKITEGAIGLIVQPHSRLAANRFIVSGSSMPGTTRYLFTDAILGAGEANGSWTDSADSSFKYGKGAVSTRPGARAKWNIDGSSFSLWAPTGPDYGTARLLVDGVSCGEVDFRALQPEYSKIVWRSELLPNRPHAIVLVAGVKPVPLDSLDAESPTE